MNYFSFTPQVSDMKILFVVSEKGFWAEECIEPLKTINREHEVEIATPTGERPEPDPESTEGYEKFLKESEELEDPITVLEAYRNSGEYDGLVLPGGHGTLWDINQDVHIQELLEELTEENGGLVICHAVGILGFMPEFTDGRLVTGFPNEWENGQVDENEIRNGEKLPYRVQNLVKEAGADWRSNLDSDVSVEVDGNLVTARGPDSSKEGAEKFLEILEG